MSPLRHIFAPLLALLAMLCLPCSIAAQAKVVKVGDYSEGSLPMKNIVELDSLEVQEMLGDMNYQGFTGTLVTTSPKQPIAFTPDPAKATWSALVFPGGGQIYNHKYWKLPIVYGGFLGCAYALNWNNQMYNDYSQAYLDIMDDDPGTASYEDFLPPRYNVEANKEYLTRVFKNRKDIYRRQRDLSIFCFIGVYLISVVDAYVDAELSNFDISDDLSLQVRPTTIDSKQMNLRNQAYGLQCSFSF